jgi:hemolysin activation/secretion protein
LKVLPDKAQQDLISLLRLQKNIKRSSTAQWDPSVENFLSKLSIFVQEHNPNSFTVSVDDKGNPDVSFTWSL